MGRARLGTVPDSGMLAGQLPGGQLSLVRSDTGDRGNGTRARLPQQPVSLPSGRRGLSLFVISLVALTGSRA